MEYLVFHIASLLDPIWTSFKKSAKRFLTKEQLLPLELTVIKSSVHYVDVFELNLLLMFSRRNVPSNAHSADVK